MRVDTLTPEIPAVPGTTVSCRLNVVNEATSPASLSVRVYGLGPDEPHLLPGDPIPAGSASEVVVPLSIPETFSDGHHSLAIEVRSDRQGEGVVLAPVSINVASLDRVILRIVPGVLRGHRRKRFLLEVDNRRDDNVDLELAGDAPDLDVRLDPHRLRLQPGEKANVQGHVVAPRHLTGDERQHVLLVSGHGAATPSYATAAFTQRPTFARGLRGLMAGLAILGLWAAVIGGGAYWYSQRGNSKKTASQQASGSKATPTTVAGAAGTGTNPAGSTAGATGGTGTSGGAGSAGGPALPPGVTVGAPTATLVRGTVKAGVTGANGNVIVTLNPLVAGLAKPAPRSALQAVPSTGLVSGVRLLGAVASPSDVSGASNSGGGADETKFWSARSGSYLGGSHLAGTLATLSVESTNSAIDGTFKFADVPLRRTYEVSFAKPGFDTQSFQISPTDDGKPVEMKVVLLPGKGALGGQMTGPDGQPLGGVKLSITDGTLSFTTTSSTDAADRGKWLIEGISTPGTYTVIATLDGYGTQVAQVTLTPKERKLDLGISMSTGVGSIAGRVLGPSGAFGGVTLTASNGSTTRTTNSFTAGATGSYLFPSLPVPGKYTVTASAPGYSTQTQVVALKDNATGINFQMVSTSATITGVVMSVDPTGARPPAPLPNASIELTLGALKVRSTSAVAPDPGSFTLNNLPPGDYTITFGRYDHTSESRPITLTAGQVLDLGQILLMFTPRAQLQPTGSLSVTINQLVNGSPQPLDLVSLTLTDIAGRISIVNPPPSSVTGSFKYEKVPIGTYRLLVERTGFRPFTVPRINIGLGNVDQPVTMLKFGQAFGQVVDPLPTPTPLDNYELLLYQDLHPGLICKAALPVAPGTPVDGQGKIRWEVGVGLQLLSGDYVVRFRPAPGDVGTPCATGGRLPPGHTDQPDGNGNVGSFTVAADNDAPIELPDIPVYRYPSVRGLVLAPQFSAGTVSFVGLAGLVANDLAVTLDCGTGTVLTAVLTRTANAASFVFDQNAVGTMFGSASLPPGGVLPTCTVRATANTFASVTAVLPTPLVIPTALPFQDRVVNIALVSDPAVLLGTVYWKDAANGNPIFVGGADVTAPGAIVAFGPQQTTDPDGPGGVNPTAGNPPAITADLATQSAAGTGFWSFPGVRQAFGAATYTFTHSTTLTGSFDLTINESGRTVTASTGLAEPVVDDGNLDIVVLPKPGRIDGSVSIVTARSPLPYGDAVIRATPPGATPVDVPVAADGSYAVTPAAAGTWGLELASTPTGNLEPQPGQATQQVFVDATASAVAQPRQYVELGQVVTEFTDSANANAPVATYTVGAVSYPRMNVSLVSGPAPFPAWTDRVGNPGAEVGDASGRATAQRLSVSSVAPTALQMNYQITYDMPGYDLATATWQAFNEANVQIASGTGTPTTQLQIPLQIFAGTRVRIVVSAPKYGSISGVVRGLLHPPSVLPADVEPLTLAPAGPLTVTAQPVQDAAGTQFVPPATAISASPGTGTGGFTFSVPAGFYLLTYADPEFDTKTAVVQVVAAQNTPASADLNIAQGSFELTIVTDEASDAPVVAATVQLWPGGTPIGSIGSIAPSYSGTTNAAGFIDFDPSTPNVPPAPYATGTGPGIYPGSYLMVVRKADPANAARDANFPVIATIAVPRGSTPAARTVAKRAVMPRTDGSITGTVFATNGVRAVNVPPFTVTRTFAIPQAAGPDAVNNTATEADQHRLFPQASRQFPTPTGTSQIYNFAELAAGVHTLTFSPAAGFTAPPAIQVTVDGASLATAADATYVANSVQVRITLPGLVAATSHPDVGVSMTSPAGGAALTSTEDPAAPGTWVFNAVLPETANYTIAIAAVHYTVNNAADLSLNVPPSGTAVTHSVPVTPLSIITGTATKQLTASTTGPVTETNSVQLVRVSNGTVVATTTPDSGGGYSFTVTTVQTLEVRVTVSGFKQAIVAVPTYTLAHTVPVPTAFVDKYATLAITVAGAPVSTATVTANPSTGVTVTESPPGVFTASPLDPAIAYTFNISAPGFQSQTYPTTGTFTPAIGSNTAVTVTLDANGTISGQTFKGAVGTASTVSLFRGGSLVAGPTGTSATGVYSFSGLTNGNYTVQASAPGVGAGQRTGITITGSNLSRANQNVALTARSLTVQFTITPGAAVPTITINGAAGTAGQISFTFPEDGDRTFTITAPGYLADNGTAAIPANWNGTDTVTVARTLTAIAVTGTVAGAAANFPATVYLCASTVTDPAVCATSAQNVDVAAAGGSFSISPVVAGSYQIVASGSGGGFTPLVAVTVTAGGVVTPSPLTLTFP